MAEFVDGLPFQMLRESIYAWFCCQTGKLCITHFLIEGSRHED